VINTQQQYPQTVVASALWNMEPTIDRVLAAVKSNQFKGEDYGQYSGMKFKGSELAPLGTFEGKVPAAVMDKVRAREKEIHGRQVADQGGRQRTEVGQVSRPAGN